MVPYDRVLLLDSNVERLVQFSRCLVQAGLRVLAELSSERQLLHSLDRWRPDALVMSEQQASSKSVDLIERVEHFCAVPVVLFVDLDQPQWLEPLVDAGLSGYVVGDRAPEHVASAIAVSVRRYHRMQKIQSELTATRNKLARRINVEKAKGMIMNAHGLSEEEAYRVLQKMSMDLGQPLSQVALQVVGLVGTIKPGSKSSNE